MIVSQEQSYLSIKAISMAAGTSIFSLKKKAQVSLIEF
jgi:hypothetical protein